MIQGIFENDCPHKQVLENQLEPRTIRLGFTFTMGYEPSLETESG